MHFCATSKLKSEPVLAFVLLLVTTVGFGQLS